MAAVISAILIAAPAAAQELPNFKFRDAVAEAIGDPKEIGDSCLPTNVPNERRCLELGAKVADQELRWLIALTYHRRLTSLMGVFEPASLKWLTIAFTAIYGEPCDTEEVEWPSATGSTSRATKLTWCFKTGKLEMQAPGRNIREGYFVYIDDWQPAGL